MADSPTLQKNNDVTISESAVDVGVESDDVSSKAHLLLEEATSLATAPPHVRDLVNSLGSNPDPEDVTTALAVVVLVQSGFRITKSDSTSSTRTFDIRIMRRLRSLPSGWVQPGRAGRYELPLWLSGRPDAECRLVGFLSHETLLLTILILPDTSFSMALQPMSVDGHWDSLPIICQRTYQLAAEVRTHLLRDSMVLYPALTGIPHELIMAIFSYLDAKDLCKLSCVCRSFNEIAKDNILWKRLLHLRFPDASDPEDGDFKKAYAKEEERLERNRVRLLAGSVPVRRYPPGGYHFLPYSQFFPYRNIFRIPTRDFPYRYPL